ncbi:MAG TPA: hypothetical protein VNP73_01375, partial [Actinomycetota bacterium]|nr:hypothetical protein [Actinomycetota bacterium]
MKPKGDRRRLVYVLLVAILVGTVVIPLSAARAACGEQNGQWVSVSGPNFGDGPQAIVAFAIDSRNPRRMFASNGPTVMRSQDGGCSWRESLVVAEETSFQRPVGEPPRVKSIAIPEGNGARVYLLLEEQVGPATRPHVMVSANGGNSWTVSDTALPPLGTPGLLRAAPSNPAVAYLTVDVAGASDALFATQDGGGSWQLRSRVPTGGLIDMKIDPLDAQNIWLGGATGLFHSTDGGLQFEAIPQFADAPAGPIDVFHGPKGPARLFVFSSAGPS